MPRKTKFDPRKMMELAIKAMKRSIGEARSDDKASPLVGAVLVKKDGTVETACRGELREGDHAEFTLLERKNRHVCLDGSRLFATLEPCAPGCRKHPKLSCSERIVNARIKEVWVGIQDPDPTVNRKGIQFLQDNGVTIQMFDRDLQEQIETANEKFIAQAIERRVKAEEEVKPPALSEFESAAPQADLTDLSMEALAAYHELAEVPAPMESEPFYRRLMQQGLLIKKENRWVPSGFGLLLFGKAPRATMPQAGLLATIRYGRNEVETEDFDGPQVLAPAQVLSWVRGKIPNPIDRSDARRKGANDRFFELLREAVVNAIVHRDYDIGQAKCQMEVAPDKVVIRSPGRPVEPITLEQMQSFDAPMLSRNPVLHYVFAKMQLAEERGLGLKSMLERAEELGLPLPTYSWKDPYLVLTLYRSGAGAVQSLRPAISGQLTKEELVGWEFLSGRKEVTQASYSEHMRVTSRTAQRHLSRMIGLGLLRRVGNGPATRYHVVAP